MKYGNYNYLFVEVTPVNQTRGTFTQETANRIKAARSGAARIEMGESILYPAVFSVEGENATFIGVSGSQQGNQSVRVEANLSTCEYTFTI